MVTTGRGITSRTILAVSACLAILIAGVGRGSAAEGLSSPHADTSGLKPGLAATYVRDFFDDVDEVGEFIDDWGRGKPGEPVARIDFDTKKGDAVLSSTASRGIGARLTGFLEFPEAGLYQLIVTSNDGVSVRVGDSEVFRDPRAHPHRTSAPIPLQVARPGWFPLLVQYFQKNGSAALVFEWIPPGGSKQVIPDSAYAHQP